MVVSELGGLGANESGPAAHNWSRPSLLTEVLPWLAILAMPLLKPNRCKSAWWIRALLGCLAVATNAPRLVLEILPSSQFERITEWLSILGFGLAPERRCRAAHDRRAKTGRAPARRGVKPQRACPLPMLSGIGARCDGFHRPSSTAVLVLLCWLADGYILPYCSHELRVVHGSSKAVVPWRPGGVPGLWLRQDGRAMFCPPGETKYCWLCLTGVYGRSAAGGRMMKNTD
jgi:hypothetical protein